MSINLINQQDLTTLANCDLNRQIIALQTTPGQDNPKIIIIKKSDVTYLQLFLKFFGCGKLAHTEVRLKEAAYHLSRFDWTANATRDQDSIEYQAYLKTCELANKTLYYKKDFTLFNRVSIQTTTPRRPKT